MYFDLTYFQAEICAHLAVLSRKKLIRSLSSQWEMYLDNGEIHNLQAKGDGQVCEIVVTVIYLLPTNFVIAGRDNLLPILRIIFNSARAAGATVI